MDQKFRNKYRIPSARLPTWDYGSNAAYFITICTHQMQHFFGNITDGKMQLSETGNIAHKYWHAIPEHFPFIKLGEFITMPNHIHGIIIIDKSPDYDVQTPNLGVSTRPEIPESEIPALPDENRIPAGNPEKSKSGGKNEQWKPGTLGVIINQYKRICTIKARKTNPNFAWQTRYYDNVIRDDHSFFHISQYIKNNPAKWKEDRFHKGSKNNS